MSQAHFQNFIIRDFQLVQETDKENSMECVMLFYCLKVIIYWLSVSSRMSREFLWNALCCHIALFTARLYLSEWARQKQFGSDLFWGCTRFLCWLNSFSIQLQVKWIGCFSTNFCIYIQSFRGFLNRGANLLAVFCVAFAGTYL